MNDPPVKKYDLDRTVRLAIRIALIVGIFFLVRYLADVLIPFAVAVLLAYLINPLVIWVDRVIKRRTLSVFVTVIGGGIAVLGAMAVMVPVVHGELTEMAYLVGEKSGVTSGEAAQAWSAKFEAFRKRQPEWVQSLLDQVDRLATREKIGELSVKVAQYLAPGAWGLISGAWSVIIGITGLVVVILYLVFLLIDYPKYATQWKGLIPQDYRQHLGGFFEEFTEIMSRYVRGQFVVAFFTGILFAVGFGLIGLRLAILFGLFVGALNLIPYLQIVALVPALLFAVVRAIEHSSGLGWSIGLVLLVFAVVQIIQDGFIVPRIMGEVTGLNPLAILLGLFIWGKLFGFLGLVIAIPMTCLVTAYYRRFVLHEPEAGLLTPVSEPGPVK